MLCFAGTVFAQLHAPPRPGFDVRTKITKERGGMISDVESTATSESELVLKAQEQYLTTILERTETNTLETLERIRRAEAQTGPPPVHARVRVVNKAGVSDQSEIGKSAIKKTLIFKQSIEFDSFFRI